MREGDIELIEHDREIEESEKTAILRAKRMKSIADVLEEVEVLIDTHFFNELSEKKSSMFLKKIIANHNVIDTTLLKKTGRTLNCTPKTMKVIREIQENLLCVGKRKEFITKKRQRRHASAARRGGH